MAAPGEPASDGAPGANPTPARSTVARSVADVVAYAVVGVLLTLALVAPPVWGLLDPRLPISLDPTLLPPGALGERYSARGDALLYSGRNGVPEDGAGDDVVLLDPDGWRVRLYLGAGEGLLGLAVAVAVAREVARLTRALALAPRSADLATEALRAAGLAVPGVGLAVAALLLVDHAAPDLARSLEQDGPWPLFVPVRGAVLGTVVVLGWAIAFGYRRSRPPAP